MSDSEQKPAKVIRASSGSTRLSASGGEAKAAEKAPTSPPKTGSGPAASGPVGSAGSGAGTKARSVKAGTTRLKASSDAGASGSGPAAAAGASGPAGAGRGSGPRTAVSPTARAADASGTAASGPSGSQRVAGAGRREDADGSVRASAGPVKMSGQTKRKGPRTVRLTVATVDPWSVMKMTFLLSLALGIATVIAFLVLWLVLQATGTLNGIQTTLAELAGTEGAEKVVGFFGLGNVLSFAVVLSLVNMILMTALSTLFAFLYNIGATLVGGFHLKLTDD